MVAEQLKKYWENGSKYIDLSLLDMAKFLSGSGIQPARMDELFSSTRFNASSPFVKPLGVCQS